MIRLYTSVIAIVVLISSAFLVTTNSAAFNLFGSHSTVKDINGTVKIPIADVANGKAQHYQFKHEGQVIKFFVVKSNDGVIRAAFDACDVCFPARKGYSQDGDYMICNNCGRRFHSSRINVEQGGCNPAPLKRKVVDDSLVIAVADILPGKRFF